MKKGPIFYAGLRQVESLHDAVTWTLGGSTLPAENPAQVRHWLKDQGMPDFEGDVEAGHELTEISVAMMELFCQEYGAYLQSLARASEAPDPQLIDIGFERSGAGYQDTASFIITSAFVRLLGAEEQFELDVLKALFYYRPSGLLGHEADHETLEAEKHVMMEEPEIQGEKQVYRNPPAWTWIRKHAENNVERARIFKDVFGIRTLPEGYNGKQRQDWHEIRNAIAHGREHRGKRVKITLREYVDVEVFVAKSMKRVAEQCKESLKLIV